MARFGPVLPATRERFRFQARLFRQVTLDTAEIACSAYQIRAWPYVRLGTRSDVSCETLGKSASADAPPLARTPDWLYLHLLTNDLRA